MNKDDKDKFARVEQQIIEQESPHRLNQLTDFPYKTLNELREAHQKKEIVFGSDYNGDFLKVIGTKSDNVLHAVWVSLPIIIVVTDIVLAIIFKKWILLLGILFALIGFLSSSPYNPLKKPVSGLGGLMFTASFFFLDWTWTVIIGSMLFGQVFTMIAREQYRMIVEETALKSEVLFCYMLKNKHLLVKDTRTDRLLNAN